MTTQPEESLTLARRILAVVARSPGITTNVLCREIRVRKSDVLYELEALRQEQLLWFESGQRGSKCWHLVDGPGHQFLTCSRSTSVATSELAGSDHVA